MIVSHDAWSVRMCFGSAQVPSPALDKSSISISHELAYPTTQVYGSNTLRQPAYTCSQRGPNPCALHVSTGLLQGVHG